VSREIDALVAEHVMGLDPKHFNRRQSYHEIMEGGLALKGYSTNIAAAWEVVEKMRGWAEGCGYHVEINGDGGGWKVKFGPFYAFSEEVLPPAICLAALKTKNIEVPK